jgi:hypothetical protein
LHWHSSRYRCDLSDYWSRRRSYRFGRYWFAFLMGWRLALLRGLDGFSMNRQRAAFHWLFDALPAITAFTALAAITVTAAAFPLRALLAFFLPLGANGKFGR